MEFAYYNGCFGRREEIYVPLSDRALFFGDGVYDAAVGKNGKIFLREEHNDRLYTNAKKLKITPYVGREELNKILDEVILRSGLTEYFIYVQFSRSKVLRVHSAVGAGANLLVTVSPWSLPSPQKHLALITAEDLRYLYCDIKTVNLLPAVLASTRAEEFGADEAVFHRGETVTECAHSNISILKDGTLITHPESPLILPGITRRALIRAAGSLGIPVSERPFTLAELYSADEVLVSSTTKLVLSAKSIDGKPVGGKDEGSFLALWTTLCEDFNNFTYN